MSNFRPPKLKLKTKSKTTLISLPSVLVLLLTIQTLKAACAKGCLKCSSEDKCIICDTTEDFYLKDDKCLKLKPENCKNIDLAGNCLNCKSGFYIN